MTSEQMETLRDWLGMLSGSMLMRSQHSRRIAALSAALSELEQAGRMRELAYKLAMALEQYEPEFGPLLDPLQRLLGGDQALALGCPRLRNLVVGTLQFGVVLVGEAQRLLGGGQPGLKVRNLLFADG